MHRGQADIMGYACVNMGGEELGEEGRVTGAGHLRARGQAVS